MTPRLQVLARQEDFRRPTIGIARRVRATTLGAIVLTAAGSGTIVPAGAG